MGKYFVEFNLLCRILIFNQFPDSGRPVRESGCDDICRGLILNFNRMLQRGNIQKNASVKTLAI